MSNRAPKRRYEGLIRGRHHVVVQPAVVLWDFGDTLVDERWMRIAPPDHPTWETTWTAVMADCADAWNIGVISKAEVFEALASRTGMALDRIEAHARACCQQLVFNKTAWSVAKQRRLPQAIVTVNPDLFADYVVPTHDLRAVFDVIVMSFAEGTNDKSTLCDIARARLGHHGARAEALLIDNRSDLVHAWQAVGGAGYVFRSDEQFLSDLPSLFGAADIA